MTGQDFKMNNLGCVIFLSQKDKKKGTFLFYDPFTEVNKLVVKNQLDVEFDKNADGEYTPIRIKIADRFRQGSENYL
ncbi:MAG: hypothetical protein ACXQS8_08015, partial [Candidatus Helarchaeales archaeon]